MTDQHMQQSEQRGAGHRYLVAMPYGIGDVVHIGLAVVDQIIRNDPLAFGNIDLLCNLMQAEVLGADPRITPVAVERELFPTQHKRTWLRSLSVAHPRARVLLGYFQRQAYRAVFPGNAAFRFAHKIGCPVMYPEFSSVVQDFSALRRYQDAQAGRQARRIVNRFFGDVLPPPSIGDPVAMYVEESAVEEAEVFVQEVRRKTQSEKVILLAPDTTSRVTRPPASLFSALIERILETRADASIIILPAFDSDISEQIHALLPENMLPRAVKMRTYPRSHLMFVAALTDRVDAVITGDTGVMHLAATDKIVAAQCQGENGLKLRNVVNTIALFGGTNPGLYGHPTKTLILGRGNRIQRSIRPGFLKEGYNPGNRDYFGHLEPEAILEALSAILSA